MRNQVGLWLQGDGLWVSPLHRATHTYVIGQPGTGKTKALESWIMQDILSGHGVGVMDPAGDLYQSLLFRLSALADREPGLVDRVVLIDPSDPVWTVGFNPLEPIRNVARERLAWFLTDVIVKIWKIEASSAPRMLRLLTFTFLVLSELELSLVELPHFLSDPDWRDSLLRRSHNGEAIQYFRFEFPKSAAGVHQWVTPVLNKIGALIFDPDTRLMLTGRSTIHLRQILDQNGILLVNLSKGLLGEGNSALLGAFLIAHIQQAALSRANSRVRAPFFLYLDEFQNYTTDNIKDILAESRKYGLSLILAHQYLDQLSDELRAAVLNTTGTIASFRVGHPDASLLAKEIFPPGFLKTPARAPGYGRLGHGLSAFLQEDPGPTGPEATTALLTQLKPREFWAKRRGPSQPVKLRTMNMPEPVVTKDTWNVRREFLDRVGQRCGKLKRDIRTSVKYNRGSDHAARDPRGIITDYEDK